MRRIALLMCLALGACSTSSVSTLQTDLNNFTAGVQAVNSAIAQISPELFQNCQAIESTVSLLGAFSSSSSKWAADVSAGNAAIQTFCQSPPADITSAVAQTAAAAANANAAYSQARTGH